MQPDHPESTLLPLLAEPSRKDQSPCCPSTSSTLPPVQYYYSPIRQTLRSKGFLGTRFIDGNDEIEEDWYSKSHGTSHVSGHLLRSSCICASVIIDWKVKQSQPSALSSMKRASKNWNHRRAYTILCFVIATVWWLRGWFFWQLLGRTRLTCRICWWLLWRCWTRSFTCWYWWRRPPVWNCSHPIESLKNAPFDYLCESVNELKSLLLKG